MGDRCYFSIQLRKTRAAEISDKYDLHVEYEEGDEAVLIHQEANYGGSSILDGLVADREIFLGYSEAGADYGPTRFACDGEKLIQLEVDWQKQLYAVIHDDGTVDQAMIDDAKALQALEARVVNLLDPERL